MEQRTGLRALLIVDLSSLDSYTDRHGLPEGSELGYVLACRIDFSLCGMDEDAEGGGAA